MTHVVAYIPKVNIVGGTELSLREICDQLRLLLPASYTVESFDSLASLLSAIGRMPENSKVAIVMSYKDICSDVLQVALSRRGRVKLFCKLYDPHVRQLQASIFSRGLFYLFGATALNLVSRFILGSWLDKKGFVNANLLQLHSLSGIWVYPAERYVALTFQLPQLIKGEFHLPPIQFQARKLLLDRVRVGEREPCVSFFFIGRLEGWKGRIAYEVAKVLATRTNQSNLITFHIVGTGPWLSKILSLSRHSSAYTICSYGALYGDDLFSFFEKMAACGSIYVGTGVAALQAAAQRFPVIKVSIPDTRLRHTLRFGTLNVLDGDLGVFTSDSHAYNYSTFDEVCNRIQRVGTEHIFLEQEVFRSAFNMANYYDDVVSHVTSGP